MPELDEKTREARTELAKNDGFGKWLAEPMTAFAVGIMPKGHADALQMLMRSAFDAGYRIGAGQVAGEFANAILEGFMKKHPDK